MARRGLVLGAGGVLGAAWTTGTLAALEQVEGFDPRDAEVVIGTSAGAVVAALLGAGVPVSVLRDHQRGLPLPEGFPVVWDHETGTGAAVPSRPRPVPGSPDLLLRSARHPRRVRPRSVFWALVPEGTGTLEPLRAMVEGLVGPGRWAPRTGVWVVAMDYASGQRVVFGREGAPPASLSQAVIASSSIPGWYAPQVIAGRRYVDGGAYSGASVDLAAGLGLDHVDVLVPMASLAPDRPGSVAGRLERRWRRHVTRLAQREALVVERSGTSVRLLAPGAEDLAAMGANLMDTARRRDVLETSLRTGVRALRGGRGTGSGAGELAASG